MRDITHSVLSKKTVPKIKNSFFSPKKFITALAVSLGIAGISLSALAVASTRLDWTGQGVTNGTLDTTQCDENSTPYLLWVFTGGSGVTSANITIKDNGNTVVNNVAMTQQGGGSFHYTSNFYTLSTISASVSYVGTASNPQLVISHGCAGKASPTIATTPNPTSAVIGTTLNDSATLTGGNSPTGSVTFSLYGPSDPTCSGTAVYTETDPTAPYATSTGFASNAIGTWHWTAHYAGDANNNPADSACADEAVTVTKATPTLTTTASGPVIVGNNITDTAHLGGGYGTLSGSITFDVFAPGDTTCSTAINVPPSKTVSGTGDYTSGNYLTTAVGDYRWIAHYSGNTFNNAVDTLCNDANETSTVNKATPNIITTPNPTTGTIGVVLNDSATVSGGYNPTGTVTFNLYSPAAPTCTGTPAYTQTVNLSGGTASTSPGFTSNAAGTWRWVATYNGDTNNNTVTSGCNDELVTITQPLWCSPGFWATALKFNRTGVLNYLTSHGIYLTTTKYITVQNWSGVHLKSGNPNTVTLADVLLSPSKYGGPAFNAVADWIAMELGWGGTQLTGENCPLDAHGNSTGGTLLTITAL